MRLTYNMHQYKDVLPDFIDRKTGTSTLCLVCAVAKLMTYLRRAPYFPQTIVDLFNVNGGFNVDPADGTRTVMRWSAFNEIWKDIYVIPLFWNKSIHYDLSAIRLPTIVSVDGNRIVSGYQSHFVLIENLIYGGDKIVNAEIFDPWHDRTILLVPHYGDTLRESIYTIVNFVRK